MNFHVHVEDISFLVQVFCLTNPITISLIRRIFGLALLGEGEARKIPKKNKNKKYCDN